MGKSAQIGFHVWLADAMEGKLLWLVTWFIAILSPNLTIVVTNRYIASSPFPKETPSPAPSGRRGFLRKGRTTKGSKGL
jgi:hypothetical protein